LILRGVLAVIVGIIVVAWSDVTVLALAILFAVYTVKDYLRRSARDTCTELRHVRARVQGSAAARGSRRNPAAS
jgi:hypothetical protein